MKTLFQYLLLVVSSIVLLSCSTVVMACSCLKTPQPCEEFGSVKAVFVGKVIGAKQQRREREDDGTTTTYDVGEIYFKICTRTRLLTSAEEDLDWLTEKKEKISTESAILFNWIAILKT